MNGPADIYMWKRLDERVTTSGQPTEDQLRDIKDLGVTHVVNLALHSHEKALSDEAASVRALGMTYVHIPVAFDQPTEADFQDFCAAMEQIGEAPVHVHCIVNARVSAFFYRYNRDVRGMDEGKARAAMESIWRPGGVWAAFIGDQSAVALPHRPGRTISIRPAAVSEHAALESLQFAASVAVEAQREVLLANPGINRFPAEQIAEGHVYVAERDGEIVGFSALLPREDGNAELDGLFVRPDVWRSGIGGRLMQAAETLAVQRGAATLYVAANPHAVLFYLACDFEIIGEQPRDSWPQTLFDAAFFMKKALNVAG